MVFHIYARIRKNMLVTGISSCAFSYFLIQWAVAVPRFETERNLIHVPYKLTDTAVDAGRGSSLTAGFASRLQASGEQAAMRVARRRWPSSSPPSHSSAIRRCGG